MSIALAFFIKECWACFDDNLILVDKYSHREGQCFENGLC